VTSTLNSWIVKSSRGATNYKAVILAAPFHSTGIDLPSSLAVQIHEQPYVHLHVTLLSTSAATPNPEYFGLAPSSAVPRTILTTNQGKREGGIESEFNSLSYHGLIREGEWAVKIFSDHELSDAWLNKMFQDRIGWIYRKEVSFRLCRALDG
jgi:prenylcysteine oxidase/farnesylcysteine lyase